MADIRRTASLLLRPPYPVAALRRFGNSILVRQGEAKAAGHGIGFDDPQPKLLAEPVARPGLLADELLRLLVVPEIFPAHRRDGNDPVAAELHHGREEAERLDAGDPALDDLADLVRKIGGDIAVD